MSRPNVGKMRDELNSLKQQVRVNTAEIKKVKEREIINMLSEKNMPGSSKPRYTYEEIAGHIGCSSGTVHNIAKDNDLNRRDLKKVK